MTHEEVAVLLEELAARIVAGDQSFDLQLIIQQALEALLSMRNAEGLRLLNRLSLLLPTEGGKVGHRYEYVRKTVEALPPLDRDKDADELRALANTVRAGS